MRLEIILVLEEARLEFSDLITETEVMLTEVHDIGLRNISQGSYENKVDKRSGEKTLIINFTGDTVPSQCQEDLDSACKKYKLKGKAMPYDTDYTLPLKNIYKIEIPAHSAVSIFSPDATGCKDLSYFLK